LIAHPYFDGAELPVASWRPAHHFCLNVLRYHGGEAVACSPQGLIPSEFLLLAL
jgi:hypothetical protein